MFRQTKNQVKHAVLELIDFAKKTFPNTAVGSLHHHFVHSCCTQCKQIGTSLKRLDFLCNNYEISNGRVHGAKVRSRTWNLVLQFQNAQILTGIQKLCNASF